MTDIRKLADTPDGYAYAAVFVALINGDEDEVDRLMSEDFTGDQLTGLQHLVSVINRKIWNARVTKGLAARGRTPDVIEGD